MLAYMNFIKINFYVVFEPYIDVYYLISSPGNYRHMVIITRLTYLTFYLLNFRKPDLTYVNHCQK